MSTSARPVSLQTTAPDPSSQKKDDQKAFQDLIASINTSGKKGFQAIEDIKLPDFNEHKSETPLFTEGDSFLFNEAHRMAIAERTSENWPAMQKFYKLFLKKVEAKTQKDIDEIKKLQKEIVEAHLFSSRELEEHREQRNRKKAHAPNTSQRKFFSERILETMPGRSHKMPRPSTSSITSNNSTSSIVDADSLPASVPQKAREAKGSYSSAEPPSPFNNNSRSVSRSASTSKNQSVHKHMFYREYQLSHTPTGRIEPSYNLGDLESAQKGTVKICVDSDLKNDIIENYLNDTLITSDFETKVMLRCQLDIKQFFDRLADDKSTDFVLLHKAAQRTQEYKTVKGALKQFSEANQKKRHYGMRSAVQYVVLMQTKLWQLKFIYDGLTRCYPEWCEKICALKSKAAKAAFGSDDQKQIQKEETELNILLKAAQEVFSQFDQAFQKLCFETANKLEKIYHHNPFVASETIGQIKNLTSILKTCLPSPKKHAKTATVQQKPIKRTRLLSKMFARSKAPPAKQNKNFSSMPVKPGQRH